MAYRVLALAVLAVLAVLALRWYHNRRTMDLRQEHADFAGWRKLALRLSQEVWECPRCSLPCLSWKAVERHQDPDQSACAWLEEHEEALTDLLARLAALSREDGQEPPRAVPWTAVTEPGEDDSTPALEDSRPAAPADPPSAAGRARQWAAMGELIDRTTREA